MSKGKGNIERRITNLEISFNKKDEKIIVNWDGEYSHKGKHLGVKTQKEVEEMFPHDNLTFLQVLYVDPYTGVPEEDLPDNVEIFRISDDD